MHASRPEIARPAEPEAEPLHGLRVVAIEGVPHTERLLMRAEALYRIDRVRAVAAACEVVEGEQQHAWRLLRAAKLLLSAGESVPAKVAIARAAAIGRHRHGAFSADLSHARGLLAQLERRHRDAERHLRLAHAADPTYAIFAASVMEFLAAHHRTDEARAFADRVQHRVTDRTYFDAVRNSLRI